MRKRRKVTKKSGDEGIDGIINEDRLGLDVIYVQAKRWKDTVGRKEIQSFVGALAGKQANKGIFITTSTFATTATEYAQTVTQKVILINGPRLADLMIEHDIGVSTTRTIALKRIDTGLFRGELMRYECHPFYPEGSKAGSKTRESEGPRILVVERLLGDSRIHRTAVNWRDDLFHERQDSRSKRGGEIVGYEVVKFGEFAGRIIFRFRNDPSAKGKLTGREGWAMEKKIVWDDEPEEA